MTTTKYVSRGGHKLRGALDTFNIDPRGKVCLDIGSSTGGFTDCLLQAGAMAVWAVDVGYGLLDYNLRQDPRVHLLERTNIRHMDASTIKDAVDLIVIDVAFISLLKVLPKVREIAKNETVILALVKPQFEGTPKEVPGGFVKDVLTRQNIVGRTREGVLTQGFKVLSECDSVMKGRQGNQETFMQLTI